MVKNTKKIQLLFFILLIIVTIVNCSEPKTDIPKFKRIKFDQSDFHKIVNIGKLDSIGYPVLNEGIRESLIEAILKDRNTYSHIFLNGTVFTVDTASISLFSAKPNCEYYYLIIRGLATTDSTEKKFILAYELVSDEEGNLYNMTQTQHVCTNCACENECSFLIIGYEIVGCKKCNLPNSGWCNHTIIGIEQRSSYLIIPIAHKI